MGYTLQFGQVVDQIGYLAGGALVSLALAFASFWGAAAIGLAGALAKAYGPASLRRVVQGYVTFFTNTPAFVQIFFLFNALPDAGLALSPIAASLAGFVLNGGAYLTEIQRAGIASVRRTELEAADTLGLSFLQCVRHVIVPHVLRVTYRPLSNFFIVMLLGTSLAALVGVEELTGRAINVSSSTFRSIEVFAVAGALYVAMSLVASLALRLFGRFALRLRPERAR